MWVEQLKNGKVKFVERYTNPMTLKEQRVSVTMDRNTARTRRQAQATLNKKIEKKLANITLTSKQPYIRLSELVELYRRSQRVTVRPATYVRNYYACESLMRILGADTVVSRLRAGYVNEKLIFLGEDVGTTNERLTRLKALIRWGYKNDLIDDISWIDKLEKGKNPQKKQRLEEKYLEADELNVLLRNMDIAKWRFLAEFTALSGLRIGEAIALNNDDVDTKRRKIVINKNRDAVNKLTGYPKNLTSNREIYMQDELYDLCLKIKKFMRNERISIGYISPLFLSNENGDYLNYYSYNSYLKDVSRRVLDKNIEITTHVMRHTHTALMAEQGVPLDIISRRLGHADSRITREIYFHVTKKMKEQDDQRIKSVKLL